MRSLLKRKTELRVLPTLSALHTNLPQEHVHSPSIASIHCLMSPPPCFLCSVRRGDAQVCRQLSSMTRQDVDAAHLLSSPTLRHNCGTEGKTDNQEESANSQSHSERIFDVPVCLLLFTAWLRHPSTSIQLCGPHHGLTANFFF